MHVPINANCPGVGECPWKSAMAGEVQLDALPYIDQGYEDPGVREAVRS